MNIKDNIFVYDCYAYMGAYVLELLVSTEAGKEHRVLWNWRNGCLWAAVCVCWEGNLGPLEETASC